MVRLSATLGLVALATLAVVPPRAVPTGDERDYLRAAVHLTRSGVHSSAPAATESPAPDAYREPGYPFLLAASWRALGLGPPDAAAADRGELGGAHARAMRGLGAGLLVLAAAAAGLAVARAGESRAAGWAAAALALASPALRQAAVTAGSEGLAAALVALVGLGLVSTVRRHGFALAALTGLAAGAASLTRGAAIVLVPAGAVALYSLARGASPRRRALLATVLFAAGLAPAVAWAIRNQRVTGHAVLADRGGQVLWTRAELDRQIATEGAPSAVFAWTPVDAVQRAGARRWPQATWSRYAWTGEGNFFTRSLRAWNEDRRPPADPLAVDRAFGRRALGEFVRHPVAHLEATVAVAWRGLFAERSPDLLRPFDLTLVAGVLLAAAWLRAAWLAAHDRRPALAALLVAPAALFAFHALATEFLPRFGVPALPLVWAVLALVVAGSRAPESAPAQKP